MTNKQELSFDYINFVKPGTRDIESPFGLLQRAALIVCELSEQFIVDEVETKGLFGYTWSAKLHGKYITEDGEEKTEHVGFIAAGGNEGSTFFNFTGKAMKYIHAPHLKTILEREKSRLTRVDICFDDHEGERTPFDVQEAYKNGQFKNRGQNPSHSLAGPWDNPDKWEQGLTYYVGNRKNGKMFRCYHKGRELGNPESNWVRHEVEYRRANKREIPLDILERPRDYFVSAYPWLEWAADAETMNAGLVRQEAQKITLNHIVHHAKRSYGKLFHFLHKKLHMDAEQILTKLRQYGSPERIDERYIWDVSGCPELERFCPSTGEILTT